MFEGQKIQQKSTTLKEFEAKKNQQKSEVMEANKSA